MCYPLLLMKPRYEVFGKSSSNTIFGAFGSEQSVTSDNSMIHIIPQSTNMCWNVVMVYCNHPAGNVWEMWHRKTSEKVNETNKFTTYGEGCKNSVSIRSRQTKGCAYGESMWPCTSQVTCAVYRCHMCCYLNQGAIPASASTLGIPFQLNYAVSWPHICKLYVRCCP